MTWLVDTGSLLRLFDQADPRHPFVRSAILLLRTRGESLATTSQNIAEFWNVSTRPVFARGGYGKSVEVTALRVRYIERTFPVLPDGPRAYHEWKGLAEEHHVKGVAVHDARLVANMIVCGVRNLLTLNPSDFRRYPGIRVETPEGIIASSSTSTS